MSRSTGTLLHRSRLRKQKREGKGKSFCPMAVDTRSTFYGKTTRKGERNFIDRRKRNA